jgi:hypothetical protein
VNDGNCNLAGEAKTVDTDIYYYHMGTSQAELIQPEIVCLFISELIKSTQKIIILGKRVDHVPLNCWHSVEINPELRLFLDMFGLAND